MSRVFYKDDLICSVIITGPSHVWLGLRFGEDAESSPVIVAKPAKGSCDHGKLDESSIREAVERGVSRANQENSSSMNPAEIAYISDDSPRYEFYEELAYRIVDAAVRGAVVKDSAK